MIDRYEEGMLGHELHAWCVDAQAEIDALRKDSERYRWLRANMVGVIHLIGRPAIGLSNLTGDDTDAAIDAAMAGQG